MSFDGMRESTEQEQAIFWRIAELSFELATKKPTRKALYELDELLGVAMRLTPTFFADPLDLDAQRAMMEWQLYRDDTRATLARLYPPQSGN